MKYLDFVDLTYKPNETDLICTFSIEPEGLSLREAAGGVAAESSVGTWTELTTEQPYVKRLAAHVFGEEGSVVKIAYPIELFEPANMPNILSSVGGIPGDKTSMLVVPIVAAAGFIIPKTSSRAITSPAGTADRVETLCPVNLSIKEIKEVVKRTNGCLVWGGSLELAPADDLFIQVEYPLGIDPMLLPSILSKKKAIGATHVVIDIPTGMGAKIKTRTEAYTLASDFVDLGKRLGLNIQCALTFGDQPLGCGIGPALEAREALTTLMGGGPPDLREKAVSLAGMLFEMVGVENPRGMAEEMIDSGKAMKKMREIIGAQGGNPEVKPEDLIVGPESAVLRSNSAGKVLWLSTDDIVRVAREAGAPKEKGAGVVLHAKLGGNVHKDGILLEIFAERSSKLASALELAGQLSPIVLSKKIEEKMILDRIPEKINHKKTFMIDR